MRKWIFGLFALLLVAVAAIYVHCAIQNGRFAAAAGFDPLQTDRVTVCTDTGRTAVITDREDILNLIDSLSRCRYIRESGAPGRTEVRYTLVFFRGNHRLADIAVGDSLIVNGVPYRVSGLSDSNPLRQVMERYLPGI